MEIKDLEYDPESPSRLVAKYDIKDTLGRVYKKKGESAGGLGTHGYWQIVINGKMQLAHRVLWEMFNGPIVGGSNMTIDHINGDKLDNTIGNLRLVPAKINSRNRKPNIKTLSKNSFVGVSKVAYYTAKEERWLYRAEWRDMDGKQRSKTFTIAKYGDKAYELAVEYRKKMIEEINAQGAGYTERHVEQTA